MATQVQTIVFFGSGPVAAKCLAQLRSDYPIEAVVTKPATKNEMESILGTSSVYATANRQDLDSLFEQGLFRSKIAILIDFGIIVSRKVIDYFPLGIINSHFSLLPQWRGADPITFAILSGQKQTGISLMLLVEAMDEGPLLAQAACDISSTTTAPRLTSNLIELSDAMLKQIVPLYLRGDVVPQPQESATLLRNEPPSYSRKLTKEDGILDWTKPATQLEREVRAFIEWPKSQTELAGKEVIITRARVHNTQMPTGKVAVENGHLYVGCGIQSLEIVDLKPAGKPEMSAAAFLAGYRRLL